MRQQNFHKKAHTASFLQVFHSGIGSNGHNYRAEVEESTALNFVTGGARPANPGEYSVEIKGHKVKVGGSFVSEAQAKWIIDIATTRETPGPAEAVLVRLEQGFAKSAGSQFITTYKNLPKKSGDAARAEAIAPGAPTISQAPDATVQVAEGRYAVEHKGVLKFFRITHGKGRWAGRTFVEVQASDDRFPVRSAAARNEVLELIAADPHAAEVRYGQKIGRCYRCGRTLTDATSRDLGIGPDCRAK